LLKLGEISVALNFKALLQGLVAAIRLTASAHVNA